jgi:hypothetical protein
MQKQSKTCEVKIRREEIETYTIIFGKFNTNLSSHRTNVEKINNHIDEFNNILNQQDLIDMVKIYFS